MKRCFGLTQVCISHYLLIYLEYKVYVYSKMDEISFAIFGTIQIVKIRLKQDWIEISIVYWDYIND